MSLPASQCASSSVSHFHFLLLQERNVLNCAICRLAVSLFSSNSLTPNGDSHFLHMFRSETFSHQHLLEFVIYHMLLRLLHSTFLCVLIIFLPPGVLYTNHGRQQRGGRENIQPLNTRKITKGSKYIFSGAKIFFPH